MTIKAWIVLALCVCASSLKSSHFAAGLKKTMASICISGAFCITPTNSPAFAAEAVKSVRDITVIYDGQPTKIGSYLGDKATLIVNINSQCDLPADGEPQCKAIGDLYKKYKGDGFQVLAFPSEQFRDVSMLGESEPIEEVRKELQAYGFDFPIFDFIDVNGANAADLYKTMKDIKSISASDLKKISWNYEKFLLDKDGVPIRRYRPNVLPSQCENDIKDYLKTGTLKPRVKAALGAV